MFSNEGPNLNNPDVTKSPKVTPNRYNGNNKNNSGRPDRNIVASLDDQFIEYEYTVDDLPPFTGFQIKVDIASTNQAQDPELLDFRAIAVA